MPDASAPTPDYMRRIDAVVSYVERLIRNKLPGKKPRPAGGGTKIRRFELKEDLVNNGKAGAYLRKWNPDTDAYETDLNTEFEVADAMGTFAGDGRDESTSPATPGDYGYYANLGDRAGVYDVIQMEC